MSFLSAAQRVSDALDNPVLDKLGKANTVWSAKSNDDGRKNNANPNQTLDAVGVGADAIGTVQMLLPRALGTPIISAGLLAIQGMTLTCGVGDPDSGDRFGQGAAQFSEVGQTLESAIPGDSWQGSASQAYAAQDSKQQDRARAIQEADMAVEAVVHDQAKQVNQTRTFLDVAATVLGYAVVPAMIARAFGPPGVAIAIGIEIGAVAGSVPPSAAAMGVMSANSTMNAAKIAQAMNKYTKVSSS
ncbi:hypothetical protein M1247_31735 [Mycobacterium sp. 21AC1]|uniref:EspA/EspE family type VII secretion system effector n=1 Tax=[Mycobacterium] appelbergii TaxID=2939269 RepID=UPI0029393F9C|nr:EspA/EspE family type VII secretion system effector [Mycobacterium sp. 21AC1]MDV3129515.1 hypothetical protein [Mycobacterium sp. 21AC1]